MAQKRKPAGKKKNAAAGKNGGSAARILRTPFLISVGALSLAEEQLSDFIDSLVKRGEKTEKAGRKYLKKLTRQTKKSAQKAEKKVEKAKPEDGWLLRTLHRLSIPTHDDIIALDKRVDKLLKKVA